MTTGADRLSGGISGTSPSSSASLSADGQPQSSSALLLAEGSGGYQGLAAIAGNLAASLSDMLGSDSDSTSVHELALMTSTSQQAQRAQQAQHAQQAQGSSAGVEQTTDALWRQFEQSWSINRTGMSQSATDTSMQDGSANGFRADPINSLAVPGNYRADFTQRMQAQAAAAAAMSEAATAPSSLLSGITGLQMHNSNAIDPKGATAASSVISGITNLQPRQTAAAWTLPTALGSTSSKASDLLDPKLQLPLDSAVSRQFSQGSAETDHRPKVSAELGVAAASSTMSGMTNLNPASAAAAAVPSSAASSMTALQTQAAAAAALSEAAEAASSTVSGLTELQPPAAAPSRAVASASALQNRAAAAFALSEASGAASSAVSGITELAAAGNAMSQPAQMPHAIATARNPFGLSGTHSVDGFALWQATVPQSSIVSGVSELMAEATAVAGGAMTAGESATAAADEATAAREPAAAGPKQASTMDTDQAAMAVALTDAVEAASSLVSGLTDLAADRKSPRASDAASNLS